MQHISLKSSSGRSMIEMLGTLALIGVLSVGALLGYSRMVAKHHANTTQTELSKWSVLYATQLMKNDTLNTAEMPQKTPSGYGLTAFVSPLSSDYFIIKLTDVPSEVCRLVLEQKWQQPVQIIANDLAFKGNTDICGQTPTTLSYLFYKDLQANSDSDCPPASQCGTLCCEPATVCAKDGITCEKPDDKECTTNNDCGKEGNKKYYCWKKYKEFGEEEKGTCKTADYTSKIAINGRKYYKSNARMSWRNGERFCSSIGKQVIDKQSDLGCLVSSTRSCPPPEPSPCNGEVLQSLYAPTETIGIWSGHFWANQYKGNWSYDLDFQTGCGTINQGETNYFVVCR